MKRFALTLIIIPMIIASTIAQVKFSIKLHPIPIMELNAPIDSTNLASMVSESFKIYNTTKYILNTNVINSKDPSLRNSQTKSEKSSMVIPKDTSGNNVVNKQNTKPIPIITYSIEVL